MRRVCEGIGLHYGAQLAKLKSDAAYRVLLISIPDKSGSKQEIACIDEDSLGLWLAGGSGDTGCPLRPQGEPQCAQKRRRPSSG